MLHVYRTLDYCVKEAICKRPLRTRADGCCFVNWHFVNVYAVAVLKRLGLFVPVPDE